MLNSLRRSEAKKTCGKEEMCRSGPPTQLALSPTAARYYPNPPKMPVDITVQDLTQREGDFTFEKNGFCLAKQTTTTMKTTQDIQDTRKITEQYYPEMQKWLQEL